MAKKVTKLALVLRERGLWGKTVAEAAGIDAGQFSCYVSGKVEPTPRIKHKIAGALDMPVDQLFCPFHALPKVEAEIEGLVAFLHSPEGQLVYQRIKTAVAL